MSIPEYASRAEFEQMRADLDEARQALRRESRNGSGSGGVNGDTPLTRVELRRALDEFREDVQDELRRAYRRGAEAERAAIAEAVCDELDSRYIDDLDVDEADDRIATRGGNGKAKPKAGTKPARGAEPTPTRGEKPHAEKGLWERLMSD